jgi:hypothetical protein
MYKQKRAAVLTENLPTTKTQVQDHIKSQN